MGCGASKSVQVIQGANVASAGDGPSASEAEIGPVAGEGQTASSLEVEGEAAETVEGTSCGGLEEKPGDTVSRHSASLTRRPASAEKASCQTPLLETVEAGDVETGHLPTDEREDVADSSSLHETTEGVDRRESGTSRSSSDVNDYSGLDQSSTERLRASPSSGLLEPTEINTEAPHTTDAMENAPVKTFPKTSTQLGSTPLGSTPLGSTSLVSGLSFKVPNPSPTLSSNPPSRASDMSLDCSGGVCQLITSSPQPAPVPAVTFPRTISPAIARPAMNTSAVIPGIGDYVPKVRLCKPAPYFKCKALMPEGNFELVSLTNFTGKYLVLFFYPGDFTFVCPTEIIEFSEKLEEFKAIDCNILACSTDSPYCHKAWCERERTCGGLGPIKFPILADVTKRLASDYGVLLEDEGIAARGLFIIDRKGIVRQMTINDLQVGRNVAEVKRLVEAFQFADKHGNVCPQGWEKGQDTIVPEPEASREFFSKFAPPSD